MRISNKNFFIIILAGVVLLIGWSWLNQSGFFNSDDNSNDSETIENENQNQNQDVNNTIEDIPRIKIIFPSNSAVLNPGPIVARYSITGNLDEAERVDFTLFKGDEIELRQQGSFSKENRSGGQMFPQLEEGEYRLMARLIKSDNSYFDSPVTEAIVNFQVKDTSKGE